MHSERGVTLIELLIAITIIAILGVVVFLTLNPAELLKQGRDVSRISDISTINKAVSLYYQGALANPNTLFMGSSSVVYVSVPDPAATSAAGDQCQGLGLPAPPVGYNYHCAASSTYLKTDGTGWVPIQFDSYAAGPVISKIPIDPMNTTSTNLYYTYETDGIGGYKLTAFFESQKYAPQMALDNGIDPELYEKGSNSSLPPARGLTAYWAFDEGSSTIAIDQSGNGNVGTWVDATGTVPYDYVAGKIGAWAAGFDASHQVYVQVPNMGAILSQHSFTVTGWMYQGALQFDNTLLYACQTQLVPNSCLHLVIRNGQPYFGFYGDDFQGGPTVNNQWYFLAYTWTGPPIGTRVIYLNGSAVAQDSPGYPLSLTSSTPGQIGLGFGAMTTGAIDDMRIYTRALSASEIMEMYNAVK